MAHATEHGKPAFKLEKIRAANKGGPPDNRSNGCIDLGSERLILFVKTHEVDASRDRLVSHSVARRSFYPYPRRKPLTRALLPATTSVENIPTFSGRRDRRFRHLPNEGFERRLIRSQELGDTRLADIGNDH